MKKDFMDCWGECVDISNDEVYSQIYDEILDNQILLYHYVIKSNVEDPVILNHYGKIVFESNILSNTYGFESRLDINQLKKVLPACSYEISEICINGKYI